MNEIEYNLICEIYGCKEALHQLTKNDGEMSVKTQPILLFLRQRILECEKKIIKFSRIIYHFN